MEVLNASGVLYANPKHPSHQFNDEVDDSCFSPYWADAHQACYVPRIVRSSGKLSTVFLASCLTRIYGWVMLFIWNLLLRAKLPAPGETLRVTSCFTTLAGISVYEPVATIFVLDEVGFWRLAWRLTSLSSKLLCGQIQLLEFCSPPGFFVGQS